MCAVTRDSESRYYPWIKIGYRIPGYLTAYHFTTIDYGFGNVTDEDDIPDLEAPTECEDEEKLKEKLKELNASCASKAQLSNGRHEDHDDDVEPPMSEDDFEVDYEFHNNAAFIQVELSLKDEDAEEKSLSQIRPTLQALNSLNMWIGDTGATRHSMKYKQGGIDSMLDIAYLTIHVDARALAFTQCKNLPPRHLPPRHFGETSKTHNTT